MERAASAPDSVTDCTVLVVDDDKYLLDLLAQWLAGAGFRVTAESLFDCAKRSVMKNCPDVLVTDIRMGADNGLQLVLLGKARNPNLHAIVLTGHDDVVLRREAITAGAIYMQKPVSPEQLIAAVREVERSGASASAATGV